MLFILVLKLIYRVDVQSDSRNNLVNFVSKNAKKNTIVNIALLLTNFIKESFFYRHPVEPPQILLESVIKEISCVRENCFKHFSINSNVVLLDRLLNWDTVYLKTGFVLEITQFNVKVIVLKANLF